MDCKCREITRLMDGWAPCRVGRWRGVLDAKPDAVNDALHTDKRNQKRLRGLTRLNVS